jgi:uncharacterized phage protein (TIGR01671 family)
MYYNNSVSICLDGEICFLYEDGEWRTSDTRIELMQFTGLKDKNDKEIYEGDLIKISYTAWDSDLIRGTDIESIEYDEENGYWFAAGYTLYELVRYQNDFDKKRTDTGCKHTFEVIGNIYENPELLKQI